MNPSSSGAQLVLKTLSDYSSCVFEVFLVNYLVFVSFWFWNRAYSLMLDIVDIHVASAGVVCVVDLVICFSCTLIGFLSADLRGTASYRGSLAGTVWNGRYCDLDCHIVSLGQYTIFYLFFKHHALGILYCTEHCFWIRTGNGSIQPGFWTNHLNLLVHQRQL